MKLKRIVAMPLCLAADILTLGNMGERSFTQQLFDAERREQRARIKEIRLQQLQALVDTKVEYVGELPAREISNLERTCRGAEVEA